MIDLDDNIYIYISLKIILYTYIDIFCSFNIERPDVILCERLCWRSFTFFNVSIIDEKGWGPKSKFHINQSLNIHVSDFLSLYTIERHEMIEGRNIDIARLE
jgi:hypothetical protein